MRVGRLIWGVKQSFRGYVEMSGGTTTLGDGVARNADGAFVFAALPASDLALDPSGRPGGVGRFTGEVAFEAHGGMLKVALVEPGVETGADGVLDLTVADRGRRVAFARLDVDALTRAADGAVTIPAKITLDGMMILGDHYPPGTVLDPVTLAVG